LEAQPPRGGSHQKGATMTPARPPASAAGTIATLGFWRDLMIVLAVLIIGLVAGASLLIPFAFALLMFVLLTAVIDWIAGRRVAGHACPGWLAHILGLGVILAGMTVVVTILGNQAAEVANAAPRYAERLDALGEGLKRHLGDDNALLLTEALAKVDIAGVALNLANDAGVFLSGLLLMLLYIPFMMVERGPLSRKLELAAGSPEAGERIRALMAAISRGVQRYVGIKSFVSIVTGGFTYLVTKSMGLDFAETWGVLAFALNFIPSIGSILGVVLPSLIALVQFDTLTPFLIIALGCGMVQFLIGNVLEPTLTGRTLNLSPLMVILALTIWTTIWGISGAFLSVPITVCVLIVFSHLKATRPVAILMSGDGRLIDESAKDTPVAGADRW
jgi:predicted PurR-regulated permease PerM